ncbi:putative arginine-tRNA-protein transferase [Rosellinia necatrix]|uniref:arginyltransferase n=1 Tax=Rosellinia necatrix TaxID=77044 RepID=A0A1W2TL37_ROSNE|nr:putative arginine-tRNA-protein transferase [Rosellinia necatrix]
MQDMDIPEDASRDAPSYITPMGYMSSSTCGYCRRSGNGRSYYTRSISMSPECYQDLVDRSWRRSGTLLYRPNQRDACCPHYTLRVDSTRFRPSRDQRQAINRFNRFVIGDNYAKEAARQHPKSREQAHKRNAEFHLAERIREGESQSLKQPPAPAHSLDVTLEIDDYTEEKYAVYENYQRIVHQEPSSEISREGFAKFLCNSPLRRKSVRGSDGQEKRLGSYHQCYRLDGQLVAVGVLDLLPHAVSAVYFLYHESIHSWSPGKLGALREISLAIEGGYRWWYPGFYIHTCPKMRYKMDYSPQQILNPDDMQWVEVSDNILAKFDSHGYLDFSSPSHDKVASPKPDQADSSMDKEGNPDDEESDSENSEDYISLLGSNMPGLPPLDDIISFDYDNIPVRLTTGIFPAVDVFQWQNEEEDIRHGSGPRGQLAQMAAAVGLDVMPQLCIDIMRG